jgi:hypothetical protein
MMLQQRIDDVLESVHLGDLLSEESVVRERLGMLPGAQPDPEERSDRALPVLQA